MTQCRVALTGGSWLDCRDALETIGKLSLASPRVAEIRESLRNILYAKFPAAHAFTSFQRNREQAHELLPDIITRPLRTPDFLSAMTSEDERLAPKCSLLACCRQLGRLLRDADSPIYERERPGLAFYRDLSTDINARDDITASNTGRHWGEGPDTVREMGTRLGRFFEEHATVKVYSRRRRRFVDVHHGCFACSKACYESIVEALRLWEGPLDTQQAIVVTSI